MTKKKNLTCALLALPFALHAANDPKPLRIEAETGQLSSGAFKENNVNASGSAYVDGLHKWEAGVEWTGIESKGGEATLTIYYSNASDGAVQKSIEINGEPAGAIEFPVTSSNKVFDGKAVKKLTLPEGETAIKVWRSGSGGDQGSVRLDVVELVLPE